VSIDDGEPCCHASPAAHFAEQPALATLLVEHDLVGTLLDRISAGGAADGLIGPLGALIDAFDAATAAIRAWKATT
jgi:hypothetical protein